MAAVAAVITRTMVASNNVEFVLHECVSGWLTDWLAGEWPAVGMAGCRDG